VPRQRVQNKAVSHANKEPTRMDEIPMQALAKVMKPDSKSTHPGENNPLQKRRQRKTHTTAPKRRPKESHFRVLYLLSGRRSKGITRLAMTQAQPTADTMTRIEHILDYIERYPANGIIFEASDMILTTHADASYQSLPGSRSKLGGAHYFANANDSPGVNNGLIAAQSAVIKVVCSGASEAEYAVLYSVGQTTYFIRLVAAACGYPQNATTIYTDNEVAMGIANRSVKIKWSTSELTK